MKKNVNHNQQVQEAFQINLLRYIYKSSGLLLHFHKMEDQRDKFEMEWPKYNRGFG